MPSTLHIDGKSCSKQVSSISQVAFLFLKQVGMYNGNVICGNYEVNFS